MSRSSIERALQDLIDQAVVAERERCARIVEAFYLPTVADEIRKPASSTNALQHMTAEQARMRELVLRGTTLATIVLRIVDADGTAAEWEIAPDHPIVEQTQLTPDRVGSCFMLDNRRYLFVGYGYDSKRREFRLTLQELVNARQAGES